LLISCGADTNYYDGEGLTSLHRAVAINTSIKIEKKRVALSPRSSYSKMVRIVSSLLEAGACVDAYERDGKIGRTPLYAACGRADANKNDYQLVKLLLSNGSNPNIPAALVQPNLAAAVHPFAARNECVRFPLSCAVRCNKHELVRLLLESGAHTAVVERDYTSVLHLAIDEIQQSDHAKRLARKEFMCKIPLCKQTVSKVPPKQRKAKITRYDEPPHQHVNCSIVKLLLDHGADANQVDHNAETPLYKACNYRSYRLERILLERGAVANPSNGCRDPLSAVNTRRTEIIHLLLPWLRGVSSGNDEAIVPLLSILLEFGADVNERDYSGRTALHLVVTGDHPATERAAARDLLLNHMANPNNLDYKYESPMYVACIKVPKTFACC